MKKEQQSMGLVICEQQNYYLILTRRSRKKPFIKAINVQLNVKNSWKTCLLKEGKM